jgi:hypothetical protein
MASGSSYNGWPANSDKDAIGVIPFGDAHGLPFPGGVKGGDVHTVFRYLAYQFHTRVEPIVEGWDWGYTYKQNVNNPSSLSCHASGTALDVNAPDHPNGSSGTFTDAQVGTIYAILDELQGAVDWLEGYDEMHFEICVNASTLAKVAATLGDTIPPTDGDWLDMATPEEITAAFAAALAGNEDLHEIRRMLGSLVGYPGPAPEQSVAQALAQALSTALAGGPGSVQENLAETRRMVGVAIGWPPAEGTPEHGLT